MIPARRRRGFTLIELLAVIAIIMMLVALALPNFVEMMRGRKWSAALGNIQLMVTRARGFAANRRTDTSVEFDINANTGTKMWIESESNLIETMPDFGTYTATLEIASSSSSASYVFRTTTWAYSGGAYDGTYDPTKTQPTNNGDNARQSETAEVGKGITIDLAQCAYFTSYDNGAKTANWPYGRDPYPDIRVGQHGALVPNTEPTLCVKEINQKQSQKYVVVRCTGRLLRQ